MATDGFDVTVDGVGVDVALFIQEGFVFSFSWVVMDGDGGVVAC